MILPEKPSDLIELALKDLAKVERSKRYVVDMNYAFHSGSKDLCSVCLAGAVMAMSLNISPETGQDPDDFPPDERDRLNALNSFRMGYVDSGICTMTSLEDDYPDLGMDHPIPKYRQDQLGFKKAMAELAVDLRAKGL